SDLPSTPLTSLRTNCVSQDSFGRWSPTSLIRSPPSLIQTEIPWKRWKAFTTFHSFTGSAVRWAWTHTTTTTVVARRHKNWCVVSRRHCHDPDRSVHHHPP
ncbi:MAG: hypothetical protein ACK55Z_30915, partial [bacterium]